MSEERTHPSSEREEGGIGYISRVRMDGMEGRRFQIGTRFIYRVPRGNLMLISIDICRIDNFQEVCNSELDSLVSVFSLSKISRICFAVRNQ